MHSGGQLLISTIHLLCLFGAAREMKWIEMAEILLPFLNIPVLIIGLWNFIFILSHSYPFFDHKHWCERQKNCSMFTTSRYSKISVIQRKSSWCTLLKSPKGSTRHLGWTASAALNGRQKRKRGLGEHWLCGNLGGGRTDIHWVDIDQRCDSHANPLWEPDRLINHSLASRIKKLHKDPVWNNVLLQRFGSASYLAILQQEKKLIFEDNNLPKGLEQSIPCGNSHVRLSRENSVSCT